VASAVIRPSTNRPTIGQVYGPESQRIDRQEHSRVTGISVEDDVREIPEGAAYRIVLDPNAADPQGPRGAGSKSQADRRFKAAKSRFIWYAGCRTSAVTAVTFIEVFLSPPARRTSESNAVAPFAYLLIRDPRENPND